MKKYVFIIGLIMVLVTGLTVGCKKITTSTTMTSTGITTSTTSSTTNTTTSIPTNTTTGNLTAAQVANAGRTIFTVNCASCHGANGQGIDGPALIGPNQNLNKYQTAQGLVDYIKTAMPFNAPGSLSQAQYLDIVVFILVLNNWLSGSTYLNQITLNSILLK